MRTHRAPRLSVNDEFAQTNGHFEEYVTNISSTGVFIHSNQPLAAGTLVDLRFTLTMTDIETVEGVGRVVRVSQDPPGMGVTFVRLTPASAVTDRFCLSIASKLRSPARRRDEGMPVARRGAATPAGGAGASERGAKSVGHGTSQALIERLQRKRRTREH